MCFFVQAEDGIRDLVRSRGLGDVYKRQREWRAEREGAGKGTDSAARWNMRSSYAEQEGKARASASGSLKPRGYTQM